MVLCLQERNNSLSAGEGIHTEVQGCDSIVFHKPLGNSIEILIVQIAIFENQLLYEFSTFEATKQETETLFADQSSEIEF